MGGVPSEARIQDGSVRLILFHPKTGEEIPLEAQSSALEGDELVVEFGPGSPNGTRKTGKYFPDELILVDTPELGPITITGGTEDLELPFTPLQQTDIDKVEVRLKRISKAALVGSWRYRVNSFIHRAADGYGRAGRLEQDDEGLWWAIGGEGWRRPKPQVYGIVPIQDQLAKEMFSDGTFMPYYEYPFASGASGNGESRTLFIFGCDLPRDWSQSIEIKAGSTGVRYVEIGRLSDYRQREERREAYRPSVADEDRSFDDFTRGRDIVKRRLDASARAKVDKLDAVIVRATLSREVVPGWQTLTYGGSENAWLLQFGDNTARLRIVRKIGRQNNEHESSSYLFSGEMIRIEIETKHPLPVKSIPIIVGSSPPGTGMDAWHEGGLLVADGEGIPAIQDLENPRIYRTEFIRVDPRLPAGKVIESTSGRPYHSVSGGHGSRVFARIGKPGIISLPPPMVQATTFATAGDTAVGGDWTRWLSIAAQCAGIPNADRVRTERAHAESISKFLINSGRSRFPIPGWVESKVSVGQHAAMLMMRDTFVRQLDRNRAGFANLQSDEEILAFRRAMEPVVLQGKTPLSRIEVIGIDGSQTTFDWTFHKAVIGDVHDKEITEVERWAINATREALRKYQDLMAAQSSRVREIDNCDVEELLKLTAYEFDAVAALAKAKLMVPAPAPLYWAPDYRARGHVDTVKFAGEQVQINEKLAEADRREAVMAVGLATIPVAIVGGAMGSGAAIVSTFAIDAIDVGYATYKEVDEKWARDAELQFAMAAADITGMRRLERAESRTRDWSAVMGTLFPQVTFAAMGMMIDAPDLFKAFGEGMTLTRVARSRKALMEANNITEAAEVVPSRAAQVSQELEESLDRTRAAQAAGESVDAPTLREPSTSGLDPEIEAALSPPARGVRFDDLPDALDSSVDDVFSYLDDLDGSGLMSQLDDAFMAEMDRLAGVVGEGANQPGWASAFRPDTFGTVKNLINARRTGIFELMEAGAERIARQLDSTDPTRARLAREVLESEPGITPARFEELVNDLVKRKPEPKGPDYFGQADPIGPTLRKRLKTLVSVWK